MTSSPWVQGPARGTCWGRVRPASSLSCALAPAVGRRTAHRARQEQLWHRQLALATVSTHCCLRTWSAHWRGLGAPACELSCEPWCRASPYAGALLGPLRSFQEGPPAQAMRRSAQLLVAEVRLPSQTYSLSSCRQLRLREQSRSESMMCGGLPVWLKTPGARAVAACMHQAAAPPHQPARMPPQAAAW